ncbi:hypothetical protein ACFOE1_10680 [Agromyces mediolanus]|uniref:Apea-like HEPN domain-containing protein n=1 Tax=Agromyces mediolanus TaxID=41986 RepID=A0A918C8J8_AGRME|nr:hypothetical protein [Agromyces mediolanus]GGR12309.1 hypothetical protein GCM10010196_00890 [Agromyces mediolanus]GLJ73344.1 hypothetical protein GCM10017583_26020 [Agromyces mediolanus]
MLHAYHWYVPLAEPLPLPGGAPLPTPERSGPAKLKLTPVTVTGPNPLDEAMHVMTLVAGHLHDTFDVPVEQELPTSASGQVTVVELTAVYDGDPPDALALSDEFDRGLELIRDVQRSYYLATQDPITLVAREQLPTMLFFLQNHGQGLEPGIYLTHHASLRRSVQPAPLSDDRRQTMAAVLRMNPGNPFWPYANLRREAYVALWLRGDYAAAVITAATAAEVILDTLLRHLLWEEGVSAEDAAAHFSSSTLATRVRRDYGPRLGGKWALDGADPVSTWHRDTAKVRNRVAHAGYEPTLEQANAALQAVIELEVHLMDLICHPKRLHRYIKTALAFTNVPGIKKRGRLSKRVQALIDSTPQSDLDLFHLWRDTAMRVD